MLARESMLVRVRINCKSSLGVIILFFGSSIACWGSFFATDPTPEAISNLLISS